MAAVKILPAGFGDALLLEWQHDHHTYHVLIDGGIPKSFEQSIKPELDRITDPWKQLDLVVITHVDFDHISGVLELANAIQLGLVPKNIVKKWWFNSGLSLDSAFKNSQDIDKSIVLSALSNSGNSQVSIRQGITLEQFLTTQETWFSELITKDSPAQQMGGAWFHFLSPDINDLQKLAKGWQELLQKEKSAHVLAKSRDYQWTIEELLDHSYRPDTSTINASSISFLWEFEGKSVLFLADATPEVYLRTIKKIVNDRGLAKLKVDVIKLSHHGSKHSFNKELLDIIDCQHFAISTDSSRHGLPDKEVLAGIILHPERKRIKRLFFYFNYDNQILRSIFKPEEENNLFESYNIECRFPQKGCNGYHFQI